MLEESSLAEKVTLLEALASRTRFRVLKSLCAAEEMNVRELRNELGLPQSTTSRELSFLRMRGFINFRREAQNHDYSCHHDGVRKLLQTLAKGAPATNNPQMTR